MGRRGSIRACILGCMVFLATAIEAAPQVTRYVLYTAGGKPAGEQVVERADDGLVTVRYVFKDNGRGPELTERLRLAPDGTLAEYEVQGTATMGGPVRERFSRTGTHAEWQSTSERGSADVAGAALYLPVNASFAPVSLAVGALARRPDGTLPLLPSGTLSQRTLREVDVSRDGQSRTVRLVAHTGVDFAPSLYWTTVEAEPRLFAVVIPGWLRGIEQGWEASLDELARLQRDAEATLLQDRAARLLQPLPGTTVVRNARIFDSLRGRLTAPSDVYVVDGRISAIRPAGTNGRADQEIDAAQRVLLPGLYDMHAHLGRWEGGLHLAAGVTTVRDLGNDNRELQAMLDEARTGRLLVPRVVPAGFIEGASPYAAQLGITIRTLEEAKNAVDWYAMRGYRQIKIYNSFPRELVKDVAAHAHARGMRVSGHVPAFMRAQEVVEQGFDEIQHINQVLLNFLVTPGTDTRTLERFYLPARELAGLDLDSAPVREFIALLKRRGTVIDPTLAIFDVLAQRDGEVPRPYAAVASHLPLHVQRALRTGGLDIPDDATAARYRASYDKMVEFVGRLHRAGVPLVAGTDSIAGFTLHAELALYVQAGLTPARALQVATRDAARITRTLDERGSVSVGKLADLVLVDGDPTQRISDLRKVALVITQGGALSPARLHEALGVQPFADVDLVPRPVVAAARAPRPR